ncbi:regulation of nuclear pre-mRNA domain-containing protein 2-like isoform X1 [Centruroides sculpturatus]|uniref:regulation of nuclear pre-mRNA domain-containing protein 2-like isoform X1 n=2 Tax=Centruroides sculpturatus TaxID=218467 RepID=UPI000C6EE1E6|nr:regulation of nuclear pre-mRNA domain-containing protein 2-like isoform X1 [Centruroides sculpturatus]
MKTMASSKLNEEKLEKKFQLVTNSQDSIQTLSLWILYHKSQHKKIVDIWLKTLKKSKVSHRLVLLYVANDVIQTCKKKSAPQFAETFAEILAEATLLIRDEKIRPMVERVFNVWDQRSVYSSEFIDELRGILSNPKVQSVSHKFVAEFKPQKVMEKIRKIKKIELESVTKLSACSSSKLDCSSSDIIYQLKDRTHGQQIVHEFDEAVRCLQEYIQIVEKELYERTQLIELLEKGETFYNAQNGEVKVVANAYRTFSGRVKNQKKKLDELISTIPSPVPSPCPDAPSPTNSDEGPLLSPLLESKSKFEDEEPPEEKPVKVPIQETKSPKQPPIEIVLPQNKQLQLPKQTMTPPLVAKQSPRPGGLEESASGMTSWIGTFNTNNPTFTKTFSLDPRISQNSSLETRLSSLMENIPNLPTIFKSSVFENQTPSTGSTPVRVDLSNINSPARQMPSYRENQSDIGELGTPVNDENRRDATPVEDEDTRFSGSNALPQVVSVVSSLTSDDLHQSLLKSLTHLQQISAVNPPTSNIPPMISESYSMGMSNARPNMGGGYPQTLPPMHKNSPPNSPLYMKSMPNKQLFSTTDRNNSSNIYTSKNMPFPTHPMQQPKIASTPLFNKTESVTGIFSKAESTPSIFSKTDSGSMIFSKAEPTTVSYNKTDPAPISYKTEPSPMMFSKSESAPLMYNKTDSTSVMFSKSESTPSSYPFASGDTDERYMHASPKVDHDRYLHTSPKQEQNVSQSDFNAEEENLEPMDMDIGESDEEDNSVPTIQESLPQTNVDIDLRVPPPSQIMSSSSTSWSSNIHTNVSNITTIPISSNSSKSDHDISSKSNSQPVESLPSQCAPIQSIKSLADKPVGSYDIFEKNISDVPPIETKSYNDEDMRQDNRNFPDRIQNDENKVSISQAQPVNKTEVNYFSEDYDDRQTNVENNAAQPKVDVPLDGNRIQTVQSVRVDNSEWDWNKELWEQRPSPPTSNRRRGQSFYDRRFPSPSYQQRFPQDPYHPSYHPRNQWNSHDSDYRRHYNPPPFNPRFPPPIAGMRGNFPPRYPM